MNLVSTDEAGASCSVDPVVEGSDPGLTHSSFGSWESNVKMIDGVGLSEMLLTYPNSTGSGYAVSSNTRNEWMRSVRPLGIQAKRTM
jgi:hypothetical protein